MTLARRLRSGALPSALLFLPCTLFPISPVQAGVIPCDTAGVTVSPKTARPSTSGCSRGSSDHSAGGANPFLS